MTAPQPGWLMRFYRAAQLGLTASQAACEHTDHDYGARQKGDTNLAMACFVSPFCQHPFDRL